MKFETWIKKQKHRDDRVGDVARDFIRGQKTRPRKTVRDSMRAFSACEAAWESLEEAEFEFYTQFCPECSNDLIQGLEK